MQESLRWKDLFKGQYSPNSYARRRVQAHAKNLASIFSSYINREDQRTIYDKVSKLKNKGKIIREFKDRKLDLYFSNIVPGRSIFEKLRRDGLEQKKQLHLFKTLFTVTRFHKKEKPERIYALLGYIYYLDYNLSYFHLKVSRDNPKDVHHVKKLLLLWTLIKEQVIIAVADYILLLAQPIITRQVEIDARDEWESKVDSTKIEYKEKIQVDNLTHFWSEEGVCSFFVWISEDQSAQPRKRFDGLLILMPDMQGLRDILSVQGRKLWRKDLELVEKRDSRLLSFVRRRVLSGENSSELFSDLLLGMNTIELIKLVSYQLNSTARVSLSMLFRKERLLPENPFGKLNIAPFELKEIQSANGKRGIINRTFKTIRKAIKQLRTCGIPSGTGSIAIQLTNDLQTREVLTEAVRRVAKYESDDRRVKECSFYDVKIVVFPSYDIETRKCQESPYELRLIEFLES